MARDDRGWRGLHRRAVRLQWFTVVWNVAEAAVAIVAGVTGSPLGAGGVVTVQTPNERVTISRSDVRTITPSNISMMPEGLLQQLSDRDVRDLVAYLRSPRQVPLPVISAGGAQP